MELHWRQVFPFSKGDVLAAASAPFSKGSVLVSTGVPFSKGDVLAAASVPFSKGSVLVSTGEKGDAVLAAASVPFSKGDVLAAARGFFFFCLLLLHFLQHFGEGSIILFRDIFQRSLLLFLEPGLPVLLLLLPHQFFSLFQGCCCFCLSLQRQQTWGWLSQTLQTFHLNKGFGSWWGCAWSSCSFSSFF